METYKTRLKKRVMVFNVCILAIAAFLTAQILGWLTPAKNVFMTDFLTGFLTSIDAVFIIVVIRFSKALRNEELLKKLYIYETDERRMFILSRSGGLAMYVSTIIVLIAGIIAGYYNITVFYALLSVSVFQILVMVSLKLYYKTTH